MAAQSLVLLGPSSPDFQDKAAPALFAPKSPTEPILRCYLLSSSKVERFPVSRAEPLASSIPDFSTEYSSRFSCFSPKILSVITIFRNNLSQTVQQVTGMPGTVCRLGPCTRLHQILHTWCSIGMGVASCSLLSLPLIPTTPCGNRRASAVLPASHTKVSQEPEFKPPSQEKGISSRVFVTSRPKGSSFRSLSCMALKLRAFGVFSVFLLKGFGR